MAGFVSEYTMRLDAKGRVPIPEQFRDVLAKDGYEGLYCIPSIVNSAIDAGGNELLKEIENLLKEYDRLSEVHEDYSTLLYGESEVLKIDKNGRILLPERLKEHAEITDEVTFVGQNNKFQMWNPKKFESYSEEASKRVLEVLLDPTTPSKSQEEGK